MAINPNDMFDPLNSAVIGFMVNAVLILGLTTVTQLGLEKLNVNLGVWKVAIGYVAVLALAKAFGYVG